MSKRTTNRRWSPSLSLFKAKGNSLRSIFLRITGVLLQVAIMYYYSGLSGENINNFFSHEDYDFIEGETKIYYLGLIFKEGWWRYFLLITFSYHALASLYCVYYVDKSWEKPKARTENMIGSLFVVIFVLLYYF